MNKTYKIVAILSTLLIVFVGCTREELSTDQFSEDHVTFAAMAPNPVARGGALRIVGSNLDRIAEVRIPGVDPITEIIQVESAQGRLSEIRIIVPIDGPEIGKVVIVDKEGKEYSSHADLTYSEPIIFTSFSTVNPVAMPGDIVTITGDYMNNIKAVQIGTSKTVTEFEEQSRYQLKVAIPADAVTGNVILCDVDENNNPDGIVPNLFYSEEQITIGKPTVESKNRGTVKPGKTITVTGKYLNMINSVVFSYADGEVTQTENVDFELAEDAKSITVILSPTVVDGNLVFTSYAGDSFDAGAYKTLLPTNLAHTAASGYKAGKDIVITGSDLDLVTELSIGEVVTEFAYANGKITATIPETSIDGKVTVKLANGYTVDAPNIVLAKPTITSLSPLTLFAGEENILVKGANLDLVTEVKLGGKATEFQYANGEITLITNLSSVSGKVSLILANGVVVESDEEITVKYHSKVIITDMPTMQHIGQEVVLRGSNFSLVENIFIGEVKVTQYSVRTDTEVRFLMPWNKAGMYNIKFLLFDGDVETVATQIEVGLELDITTIWEGSSYVTWASGAVTSLSWGGYDFSGVKPGTVLTAHFEVVDSDTQVRFGNGSWQALPTTKTFAGADGEGNISVAEGTTYIAVKLTAADIAELQNNGGLVMCGTGYKITSITLTTEISQEKTIWEGIADPQNYEVNLELGGDDNSDWINAGLQVGQKIKVYFDLQNPAEWEIQIFDAHWGGMVAPQWNQDNSDGSLGYIVLDVTEAVHTAFTTQANWGKSIILQGEGIIFTKITLQ